MGFLALAVTDGVSFSDAVKKLQKCSQGTEISIYMKDVLWHVFEDLCKMVNEMIKDKNLVVISVSCHNTKDMGSSGIVDFDIYTFKTRVVDTSIKPLQVISLYKQNVTWAGVSLLLDKLPLQLFLFGIQLTDRQKQAIIDKYHQLNFTHPNEYHIGMDYSPLIDKYSTMFTFHFETLTQPIIDAVSRGTLFRPIMHDISHFRSLAIPEHVELVVLCL